ncbi:MAG: ribosomal protein S18-alanine N-acetyltransferase [Oleibacter sp.]|nr:ribosomal protein S18-alanine N-acetyltransferase [Thalassolituus sp.]
MIIRKASLADLDKVMLVEQASHTHPWSESIVRRYLQKPGTVWALETEFDYCGHAIISQVVDEAELLMISIHPKHQGKGYGKALLTFVMSNLEQAGIRNMFLEVRESNVAAIALYESLGFCETGRRYNYYPSDRGPEDALLYSIELLD